jgi:hypothetical protein
MARLLRLAIISTLVCSFLLCPVLAGERRRAMTIVVCDEIGLDRTTVEVAKDRVNRSFRNSGIDVTWLAGCRVTPSLRSYFVVVVAPESPEGWTSRRAMGFAPVRAVARGRAYLFLDRIKDYVRTVASKDPRPATLGSALGYAMAHELGHLLIPGESHSGYGIMSPSWNDSQWRQAMQGNLVFFPEQAKIMRRTLDLLGADEPSRDAADLKVSASPCRRRLCPIQHGGCRISSVEWSAFR